MKISMIVGAVLATVLVILLGVTAAYQVLTRVGEPTAATGPAPTPPGETHPPAGSDEGFLYGRVTAVDGVVYEGRLRWGGGEEAFWGDHFNGAKLENPWVAHVPPERRPTEPSGISIFGLDLIRREREVDLGRPFMARFGEIARIEARGREVRVILKSGSVFDLDRLDASDIDDGIRVWDGRRGVVDLDSLRIRTIELLPTPALDAAPYRLQGTVRTQGGDFTGFVVWNRQGHVGTDELVGRTGEGWLSLRFDTIGSIARHSPDSSLVTLLDGREIVLSDGPDVDGRNRGIEVDDRRYGRVSISWGAFESVDFSPGGSGPAYGDFPPGHRLTGGVTTRDGRRLAGRLVYDLDESESTDTLDAPSQGVDYNIPLGLVASIVAAAGGEEGGSDEVRVTLHDGEELELRRAGDLGAGNAGLLIFTDGREQPEYVPWPEVGKVDLDRPPAMYPPLGGS